MAFYASAIVRDEPREGKGTLRGRGDEIPYKTRFAGTGGPADQCCIRANEHRRGVDSRVLRRHHVAGRRTMKRAPRMRGSSVRPATVMRFSALMVPP